MSIRCPAVLVALTFLGAVLAPTALAVPSECQLEAEPDVESGRLGRPCVTLTIPHSAACIPWSTLDFPYGSGPVCTYYLVLVPFSNGGDARGLEIDTWILYGETNGLDGLQTTELFGRAPDQPITLL